MELFNLAIPKILIAFLLGLLTAWIFPVHYPWLVYILSILTVLALLLQSLKSIDLLKFRKWIGSYLLFLVFILGFIKMQETTPNSYKNLTSIEKSIVTVENGTLKNDYWRGFGTIKIIEKQNKIEHINVKVYLTIKIKDGRIPLHGDDIVFLTPPDSIQKERNPGSFSMQDYLHPKGIYYSYFAFPDQYAIHYNNSNSPFVFFEGMRNFCQQSLQQNLSSKNYPIANALILGNKSDLENTDKENFAVAGAMHVLAVSGLHIGIIVLFINFFIGSWKKTKNKRWIYVVLGLSLIWFYAFLTGLSVSVQRAALMFSIYVIGSANEKNQLSVHSVIVSAFILLVIDPLHFFDVGFQLSFLAVIGIIVLYPMLNKLIYSRYKVIRIVWEIVCVSLAAQIATIPLTLYYFGYFSSYFLITNLLIFPLAPIVLGLGIFSIISNTIIPQLGQYIFKLLDFFIYLLDFVVEFIAKLPLASIHIGNFSLFIVFLLIIWSVYFGIHLFYKSKRSLYIFLTLTTVILLAFSFEKSNSLTKNELIIFNDKNSKNLIFKTGSKAYLISSDTSTFSKSFKQTILPYLNNNWIHHSDLSIMFLEKTRTANQIANWKDISYIKGFINLSGIIICKVSAENTQYIPEVKPDILWVSDNTYLKIKDLQNENWKGTIVLDASNSFSYRATIKRLTEKNDSILVYDINTNGAYILKL